MTNEETVKLINKIPISWTCSGDFDEVGCPHRDWEKKDLLEAIITHKRNRTYHLDLIQGYRAQIEDLTSGK